VTRGRRKYPVNYGTNIPQSLQPSIEFYDVVSSLTGNTGGQWEFRVIPSLFGHRPIVHFAFLSFNVLLNEGLQIRPTSKWT